MGRTTSVVLRRAVLSPVRDGRRVYRTVVGGKPVYAAEEFADLAPPLPPVLPEWSPVAAYGGYFKQAAAQAVAYSARTAPPVLRNSSESRFWPRHARQAGRRLALPRRIPYERKHHTAVLTWEGLPAWLTEEVYTRKIQPLLAHTTTSAIASAIGVSWAYAAHIHRGTRRPHARHWEKLAALAGVKES